jgi:hypothetical protein
MRELDGDDVSHRTSSTPYCERACLCVALQGQPEFFEYVGCDGVVSSGALFPLSTVKASQVSSNILVSHEDHSRALATLGGVRI